MTIIDAPIEQVRAEAEYLRDCITDLNERAGIRAFDEDEQRSYDEGKAALKERLAVIKRHDEIRQLAESVPAARQNGSFEAPTGLIDRTGDAFDLSEVRWDSTPGELRDRVMRGIEKKRGLNDKDREAVEETIRLAETPDGKVARHLIATGSDVYERAFGKAATRGLAFCTNEEVQALEVARAASLTNNAGGYAVPFILDPAVIDTASHTANSFRQISKVVPCAANVWHGVSSGGVTASWDAEATQVSDDTPTLAQPAITCYKGQAFVPFSVEIEGDWVGIADELRMEIIRAKDDLEGAAFATGSGSAQPYGIVTALAGGSYEVAANTAESFTIADVYALESALDARFRGRASWVANKVWYNKIRQFDTAGGAGMWERIGAGQPAQLLGYNAYESSNMDGVLPDASATANNYGLVLGDFSNYVIVDRIGLSVELVPHLFSTSNNRPTGQRGILGWFRTGANAVNAAAFRLLNVATTA